MTRNVLYKISLIFVLLFSITNSAAQNDIIRFENDSIAIKKQNDSIYFYNHQGELRQIISLQNKKSTPYGLPKEVEEIIYSGEVIGRIEISAETFPTYLYTQRYVDAGIVLCSLNVYYNELGLKTGYKEVCPNDIADGDEYHFGDKNLYKYNKHGFLIETDDTLYTYNDNGQLIEKKNRNFGTKKVYRISTYEYDKHKLVRCSIQKINSNQVYNKTKVLEYHYNDKGLLSEIIQSKRSKIILEYNEHNQIHKVSEVKKWSEKERKHTYLTYDYDTDNRIKKIKINHQSSYSDQDLGFIYDDHGNLTQETLNDKTLESYRYDSKGKLISIERNKRWGENKIAVKYE
ncbi:RHS repeat domain-containing protein [uncultured Aquimarina sp.]|uniref:RHS repeat domain-containing protein n=1 Tax=uncultured Aquimarina sp. TaxID=575652 RepID=UPI002632F004|nr:RHS repeat domain-containing protein [uncultured Aquimarina sp.]